MNTDTTDTKQALKDFIATLGLTYTATFQPTPQPKATVKDPQLHWLITLSKGTQSFQVPYHQGIGHVKGYKQAPWGGMTFAQQQEQEKFRKTCETGKLYKFMPNIDWQYITGEQPAPELIDVLYCLVSDADCLDMPSFEEWAGNYGYEEDSRKAEETYKQCLKQSLGLKNVVGYQALEKLRELYQGY